MELTDKVLINNLCSWPLHFKRLNGMGDASKCKELCSA